LPGKKLFMPREAIDMLALQQSENNQMKVFAAEPCLETNSLPARKGTDFT